jgi:cell wall-associated NlpC family hydrolase
LKSIPLYLLLLTALLSGCTAYRPSGTARNPSRAGRNAPAVVDRTAPPQQEREAKRRRPKKKADPVAPVATASGVRGELVSQAESLLGIRYKYGGNGPREGFDCSGFVKYLYDDQGISVHRVSRDQARQGRPIAAREARPGDLVFFRRGTNQPVFHVSMIVAAGPGEMWVIHPTSSRGVIRENVLASSYWRPKIYAVKDLIDGASR